MINMLFGVVTRGLLAISRKIGLSYNEINVLVYYLIVPLTWAVMVDCLIGWPIATPLLLLVWAVIFIATAGRFGAWCDRVFQKSVGFLLWFRRLGWSYQAASVCLCVWVPLAVYGILVWRLICRPW